MSSMEGEYLKKISIDFVLDQLKLRGEDAVKAHRLDRHDILIRDKDIKIKIKFGKCRQRSKCIIPRWEFSKIIHKSRLYPPDIYDYYVLVGFYDNGAIIKFWKISIDDDIIYRKNQIFIPVEDSEEYKRYELDMLKSSEFQWID